MKMVSNNIQNTKHVILNTARNAYFVGIKGVGMTALAQILKARGVDVSGSDTSEKFFTDAVLKKLKIHYKEHFSSKNIPANTGIVIASNAYIGTKNIEILEAHRRGLPLISYPEALAELFNSTHGIAVCGSHGKSTTTAMLGVIMAHAKLDPTVVVGSMVKQWGSNARAGHSKYFVIEADEYRDAFLGYKPKMIVLTNIDYDHPDYFKTEASYQKSFQKFISFVPKSKLIDGRKEPNLIYQSVLLNLQIFGAYNQMNAFLALQAALRMGVSEKTAIEALKAFRGLSRRFESYGSYNGALLFDDYAHHPTEIRALLGAVRQNYPKRQITVIFQPHTFSRTKALFAQFIDALNSADELCILKTYSSAREHGPDIWGKRLSAELGARYFATHQAAIKYFTKNLGKNSVLLAVGAGDGWQVLKAMATQSAD